MSKTAAERMREYRARRAGVGEATPGGRRGKPLSRWEKAEFIALDGEGISAGEPEIFCVPDGKTYKARDHHYTLLAASSGESLYNGGKRLDTNACLDFLCDLGNAHKKAIFVIFAGSYDVNHMLLFGLEREIIKQLSKGETVMHEANGVQYEIEYRARKSLTVRRGLSWTTDKDGNSKKVWASRITVWDVFGFFQENFVGVMRKWLGKSHPDFHFISEMKSLRGDFARIDQCTINRYNAAELSALVQLMEKVHAAIEGLQLMVTRWDGAGSIAAALFKKHDTRSFKRPARDDILPAIQCAYAGGRIEVCRIGHHAGQVWDYDVNSAYPYIMASLPCLLHGEWVYNVGTNEPPPEGFTLAHCRYSFPEGQPFYPFFYRNESMQICFADSGEGWYWWPEYKAARDFAGGMIEVIEWWHFSPRCNHQPFCWINDYYKTRQQWVKNPGEEWQKGGEKIIKLGLNSLYGKTAQQIGSRGGEPPAYHQLEWAGYITSGIRARLYEAGMTNPEAVIGFATDGIFSTAPLDIPVSESKVLGAWDLQLFSGLTLAMAGVYWWHHDKGYKHFSRGFDKDAMQSPSIVLEAWKAGKSEIDIPMYRLVGMGSAAVSDTFWDMRGRFTESMRTLRLDGYSHKRAGIDVRKSRPHRQLVFVPPCRNTEYNYGTQACSHPYPLAWLEKNEDYENELELERENMDTENI